MLFLLHTAIQYSKQKARQPNKKLIYGYCIRCCGISIFYSEHTAKTSGQQKCNVKALGIFHIKICRIFSPTHDTYLRLLMYTNTLCLFEKLAFLLKWLINVNAFSFEYASHSQWHCSDKLLQCRNFCWVLNWFITKIFLLLIGELYHWSKPPPAHAKNVNFWSPIHVFLATWTSLTILQPVNSSSC